MLLDQYPDQPGNDEKAANLAAAMQAEGVDAQAHYDLPTRTYTVTTPVTPDPRAQRVMNQLLGR